jgi:orotate phosphoribosyltransferase
MPKQDNFIKFLYDSGAIKFGSFKLKSGRIAPYFINTGSFTTSDAIRQIGRAYADTITDNVPAFDTLFGPSYKGIPLAISAAIALSESTESNHNRSCYYCFNRKEAKDHGEGGVMVGKQLSDGEKVVIVEDVITAGTAMREVVPMLRDLANVEIVGLVVLVDRMEKTDSGKSAVEGVAEEFGFPVYPIITILDIIEAIKNDVIPGKEYLEDILRYRENYGVNPAN